MNRTQLYKHLSQELPYKWRVQSCDAKQCRFVAYIDSRQVQDLLDSTGLPWQSVFYEVAGRPYCKIGIKIDGEWEFRSDTGSESNIEKEKGLASDCFKRAAVHFGIGRFLYNLGDVTWKHTKEWKNDKFSPCRTNGETIWPNEYNQLCQYIIDNNKK